MPLLHFVGLVYMNRSDLGKGLDRRKQADVLAVECLEATLELSGLSTLPAIIGVSQSLGYQISKITLTNLTTNDLQHQGFACA